MIFNKCIKSLKKLVVSHLGQTLLYYLGFQFLVWFFHFLLISIVSFFHFQLGHRLGIIENWIFHQAWEIVIVTKILALYVISRIVQIRGESRKPLRDLLTKGFEKPKMELFVVITFSLLAFFLSGQVTVSDKVSIEIFKSLVSLFGVVFFFMSDILVLNLLQELFPLSRRTWVIKLLVCPLIFWGFSHVSFRYGENLNSLIYYYLLMLLFLSSWRRVKKVKINSNITNWSLPLLYASLFIGPINSLLGIDILWGKNFSYFELIKPIYFYHLFVLSVVSICYFSVRNKEVNEN